MGSRETVRTKPLACIPVRVTKSAKAKPNTVVAVPTNTPIHREFQATPQLKSLFRQARLQMLWEVIFSRNKEKT